MHPPLFRPHPRCQKIVDLLLQCHEENPYAKYWGACNDPKIALDKCLRQEKEDRRKANAEKARKSKAAVEARIAEMKKQ